MLKRYSGQRTPDAVGKQHAPVISNNQDGVLWVEGDLGEFGLLDHLLLTHSFMLLLSNVIYMHLHQQNMGHFILKT